MSDLKTDGGSGRDGAPTAPWGRFVQIWRRRKLLVSAAVLGGLVAGALITAEIGLRVSGAVDFPLYEANPVTGYIPKANTSGRFLGRPWVVNGRHMGVARPFVPSPATDVLLVGDSLVFGTNAYSQNQRLGPNLQELSGVDVWPIGAGSWSLANELTYLDTNPDVLASADRLVFIVNYADIQAASVWKSEISHPRHTPISALAYVVRKKFFKPPSEDPRLGEEGPVLARWREFTARYGKRIDVILYPNKRLLSDPALLQMYRDRLGMLAAPNVVFHDLSRDPRWTTEDYIDRTHPKPTSMVKVARFMNEELHLKGGG